MSTPTKSAAKPNRYLPAARLGVTWLALLLACVGLELAARMKAGDIWTSVLAFVGVLTLDVVRSGARTEAKDRLWVVALGDSIVTALASAIHRFISRFPPELDPAQPRTGTAHTGAAEAGTNATVTGTPTTSAPVPAPAPPPPPSSVTGPASAADGVNPVNRGDAGNPDAALPRENGYVKRGALWHPDEG